MYVFYHRFGELSFLIFYCIIRCTLLISGICAYFDLLDITHANYITRRTYVFYHRFGELSLRLHYEAAPMFLNSRFHAPQHFLYFLPLPHGHASLRPILRPSRRKVSTTGLISLPSARTRMGSKSWFDRALNRELSCFSRLAPETAISKNSLCIP